MRATRIECRTSTVMVKLWKLSLNCREEKLPAFRPTQVTGRLTTLPGGERVGPGPAARSPGHGSARREPWAQGHGFNRTGSSSQARALAQRGRMRQRRPSASSICAQPSRQLHLCFQWGPTRGPPRVLPAGGPTGPSPQDGHCHLPQA